MLKMRQEDRTDASHHEPIEVKLFADSVEYNIEVATT